MGITTYFDGAFTLEPALTRDQVRTIKQVSKHRHSNDSHPFEPVDLVAQVPYEMPARGVKLAPVTRERATSGAEYDGDMEGSERAWPFPSIWCDWEVSEDGTRLRWNEGEKFYNYEGWLRFLIAQFLVPWEVTISGRVEFCREDDEVSGSLCALGSRIHVTYGSPPIQSGKERHLTRMVAWLRANGQHDIATLMESDVEAW